MQRDRPTDGVSEGLMQFMAGLSPDEREELATILRDPKTYLAEDIHDLVAILHQLDGE